MNIGMMWHDNTKDALAAKVKKAADYYQQKYGKPANMVWVNPAEAGEGPDGIQVVRSKSILPNNYWIGADKG